MVKSKRNTKVKYIVSKDIEGTHHFKDSLSFLYCVQLVVNFLKMYLKQQKSNLFSTMYDLPHIAIVAMFILLSDFTGKPGFISSKLKIPIE